MDGGGSGAAAGRKNVDLDGLAFSQGGHLNTNRNTSLPPGSTRTTDKVPGPVSLKPSYVSLPRKRFP